MYRARAWEAIYRAWMLKGAERALAIDTARRWHRAAIEAVRVSERIR